jgi:hypothetical protein
VGSITAGGEFVRLFNPRTDRWRDHFRLQGPVIEPQTLIGEVTVKVLGFNAPERIMERRLLQRLGRYPPPQASRLVG